MVSLYKRAKFKESFTFCTPFFKKNCPNKNEIKYTTIFLFFFSDWLSKLFLVLCSSKLNMSNANKNLGLGNSLMHTFFFLLGPPHN